MALSNAKIAPDFLKRQHGIIAPRAPMRRMVRGARGRADVAAKVPTAQLVVVAFNWTLCLLLVFLLLSQFLTIVLSSSETSRFLLYGRSPTLATYAISGSNDEPYSDRVLVCLQKRRRFEVISVNDALADSSTTATEDTSGTNADGYRVVNRTGMILSDATRFVYSNTCSRLNATMDLVFSICHALGYTNLTRDGLGIMDDKESSRRHHIRNALPVLIMPFWDNGVTARYAIPGRDGHACMFRLGGMYEVADASNAFLYAVNRTVRESKTVEWLNRPGGNWKHGWYEDTEGMRWYADLLSTNPLNPNGIASRRFDMMNMRELDCINDKSLCPSSVIQSHWGNLLLSSNADWFDSVTISNGNRYGLFLYEAFEVEIVTCMYDFASFTSDMTIAWLLVQWMLSMLAIQRGFYKRGSVWHDIDIGCLSNAASFEWLPITTLPRMKMILAAYFSAGCAFEGSQRALSDAWFVVYPAIVSMVLIQSSIVNLIARIFRRRVRSWQIPVTIMLVSIMHWQRERIASSHWFGFDGRISTVIAPEAFEAMSLVEVSLPSTCLQLSGNIKSLFLIKVFALLLNALPLVLSKDMSLTSKQSRRHTSCESECSLRVRACNLGGLGRSDLYELDCYSSRPRLMLNAYELVRLGYIVVGDTFLMSWESWFLLVVKTMSRRVFRWKTHRILVFEVITSNYGRAFKISPQPQQINLSDPRLACIKWWDIDSRPLL